MPVLAHEAKILVAGIRDEARLRSSRSLAVYDFGAADEMLSNLPRAAMAWLFRGHTLVWHKANPSLACKARYPPARKENLIDGTIYRTVAGRYRGQIHSWDVVNEAISPGSAAAIFVKQLWLKAFGPAYIDMAFHAARKADPKAMLVYND